MKRFDVDHFHFFKILLDELYNTFSSFGYGAFHSLVVDFPFFSKFAALGVVFGVFLLFSSNGRWRLDGRLVYRMEIRGNFAYGFDSNKFL